MKYGKKINKYQNIDYIDRYLPKSIVKINNGFNPNGNPKAKFIKIGITSGIK
jgi:hypothetical protein